MLVITRKQREQTKLIFDDIKELIDRDPEAAKKALSDITITVARIKKSTASIGIEAASKVVVLRGELELKQERNVA